MKREMLTAAAAIFAAAGAASAAVLPTNGLIVQLESNNVTAINGTAVSQWLDQSGRGNHAANANATFQPTYVMNATPNGKGAFDFDSHFFDVRAGVNDQTDFNKQQFTWYVVFRPDADSVALTNASPNFRGALLNTAYADMDPAAATTSGPTAWSSIVGTTTSASTTASFRGTGRNATNTFTSANAATAPGITDDQFYVGGVTWDAATGALASRIVFENGTAYTASATGTSPFADPQGHTTTRIGGAGTAAGSMSTPFDGRIAAVLIYNRVLNSTEQAELETYLRDTYIIPEPTSLLAVGAGATVLLRRRRRTV